MKDVWQKLEKYMGKCDNNQYDQTFNEVKRICKHLQVGTHHPILFARFRALLTEIYHTVRMSPEQARIMRLSSTRATTTSLYAMHWRIKSLRESLSVTCKNGFKERETQRRQQINEWVELLLSGTSDTYLLLKDLKSSEERSAFLKMLKTEIDNSAGKYSVSQLGVVEQAYKKIASTFDSNCDLAALTPEWFIPWYELIIDEWTQIGAGGFGSVYQAKWLDSDVVVKKVTLAGSDRKNNAMIFDPSQSGLSELLTSCSRSTTQNELKRAESLSMFRREVDIWFGFSHPHVVRHFGACHVGRPFFVCEYATNGTLVHYLRKNPDQLWTKLHEAALGVQYLHARNVVHGDLKGNNIVVGSDLKAKVTDFGLSSIANDETMPPVSGAWHWVAPECLATANTRPTFASDVFSLGMCIVEAMRVVEAVKSGKSIESCLPWRDQLNVVVKHHATNGTLPLRPTTCEDKQWELVKNMCALDPHSRIKISTVVDMLAELAGNEDKKLINVPSKEIFNMESASRVIASAQKSLGKLQDNMEGEESLPVLSLYTSLWKYIEEIHDRINSNEKARIAFYSLVADAHVSTSKVLEMKSSLITLTEVAMKCYSLRRRLDKLEEVREWAACWDLNSTTAKCSFPSAVKSFGDHLLLDTGFVKLGFVVFVLFSTYAFSH